MPELKTLLDDLLSSDIVRKKQALNELSNISQGNVEPLVDTVVHSEEQMIGIVLEGYAYEEGEGGQRYDFNFLRDTVQDDYWYLVAISDVLKNAGSLAVESLIFALNYSKPLVRAWAAFLLGVIGDQDAVDPLLLRLNSESQEERRSVIQALGRLKAVDAVERLIALLDDDEIAGTAAEALGKIRDLSALMPLIDLLKKHKPSVYSVSAALNAFGEHAVLPLSAVLLDNTAHRVHDLVLMELWMIGDKRAIEPISAFLQASHDKKLKSNAISALGYLKAQDAVPQIAEILRSTSDYDLGSAAAMALGHIGGREAFFELVDVLEHGEFETQHHAALAFGQMGSVEDIQPLLAALKHQNHYIRSAAAVSLGNLKDKRAVEALRQILDDPDEATRSFVVNALEKIQAANH